MGNHEIRMVMYQGESSTGLADILTPLSFRRGIKLGSFGLYVLKFLPVLNVPVI